MTTIESTPERPLTAADIRKGDVVYVPLSATKLLAEPAGTPWLEGYLERDGIIAKIERSEIPQEDGVYRKPGAGWLRPIFLRSPAGEWWMFDTDNGRKVTERYVADNLPLIRLIEEISE